MTLANSTILKTSLDPLVSIIVITYNSGAYVLETLESIKAQSYSLIELIISDDASSDNTVSICKEWIEQNEGRFVSVHLVTSEKNSGIPANCNRGLKLAKGVWIKLIAGDDALYPHAIEKGISFSRDNPAASVFASSTTYFKNTLAEENVVRQRDDGGKAFFNLDAKRQYFLLLRNNFIHGGSVFIKRDLLKTTNGFNEKYFFMEDHPYWLTVTRLGEKVYYMSEPTLKYRLHEQSVFSSQKEETLFNNFYKRKRSFEIDMIYPNIRWFEKLSLDYEYHLKSTFDALNMNRKKKFYVSLFGLLNSLSPKNLLKFTRKVKRIS